jgi:hypothetical protein
MEEWRLKRCVWDLILPRSTASGLNLGLLVLVNENARESWFVAGWKEKKEGPGKPGPSWH